jgi:hypothetical protein
MGLCLRATDSAERGSTNTVDLIRLRTVELTPKSKIVVLI